MDARQRQVGDIVGQVAGLAGTEGGGERHTRLLAAATEIGRDHDRAAGVLAASFEELSEEATHLTGAGDDLAVELDRALMALTGAVEDWVSQEGPALVRAATALSEVAGLTTVLSELVGVAGLGRTPGEGHGVGALVAHSPGSHRLIQALRRQWKDVAPRVLPEASFARPRSSSLAQALDSRE